MHFRGGFCHSYSNAAIVAAMVQDFEFGVVVGEETSDLGSTLGAMETFRLPRSGIVVDYPKARILRPNGNPSRRGVVTDVPITTPVVQHAGDPVLTEVVNLVHAQMVRGRTGSCSRVVGQPGAVKEARTSRSRPRIDVSPRQAADHYRAQSRRSSLPRSISALRWFRLHPE